MVKEVLTPGTVISPGTSCLCCKPYINVNAEEERNMGSEGEDHLDGLIISLTRTHINICMVGVMACVMVFLIWPSISSPDARASERRVSRATLTKWTTMIWVPGHPKAKKKFGRRTCRKRHPLRCSNHGGNVRAEYTIPPEVLMVYPTRSGASRIATSGRMSLSTESPASFDLLDVLLPG